MDLSQNLPPGFSQRGVTLFELLVAMILLVLVSAMLYSILNASIKFSEKGEGRIDRFSLERSFLDLLHRQVHGVWYDKRQKKLLISSEKDTLKMVTSNPLIEREAGLVLAIYRYDARDGVLYYTEKVDYYNTVYEDAPPDVEEMTAIAHGLGELDLQYDEAEGFLKVTYLGVEHEFIPRCWRSEGES